MNAETGRPRGGAPSYSAVERRVRQLLTYHEAALRTLALGPEYLAALALMSDRLRAAAPPTTPWSTTGREAARALKKRQRTLDLRMKLRLKVLLLSAEPDVVSAAESLRRLLTPPNARRGPPSLVARLEETSRRARLLRDHEALLANADPSLVTDLQAWVAAGEALEAHLAREAQRPASTAFATLHEARALLVAVRAAVQAEVRLGRAVDPALVAAVSGRGARR